MRTLADGFMACCAMFERYFQIYRKEMDGHARHYLGGLLGRAGRKRHFASQAGRLAWSAAQRACGYHLPSMDQLWARSRLRPRAGRRVRAFLSWSRRREQARLCAACSLGPVTRVETRWLPRG